MLSAIGHLRERDNVFDPRKPIGEGHALKRQFLGQGTDWPVLLHQHVLEIHALGSERVLIDSQLVPPNAWRARQTRCMLFYAVDHLPARLDEIGAVLWPDLPAPKVSRMFHVTKNRLNRALGQAGLYRHDPVSQRYAFDPVEVVILYDASQFEQTIQLARRQPPGQDALTAWKSALSLYQGEYLAGIYDDWAISRRDELALKHLNALLATARLSGELGNVDDAIEFYCMALAKDEYCEEAYLRLIELLLKCYRFTEARFWARKCQSEIADLQAPTRQIVAAVQDDRTPRPARTSYVANASSN